jgi:hypothetical protein
MKINHGHEAQRRDMKFKFFSGREEPIAESADAVWHR